MKAKSLKIQIPPKLYDKLKAKGNNMDDFEKFDFKKFHKKIKSNNQNSPKFPLVD